MNESGKLSGSRSNLTSLKNKFGSCLGLKSAADKESDHENQPPFDIGTKNSTLFFFFFFVVYISIRMLAIFFINNVVISRIIVEGNYNLVY